MSYLRFEPTYLPLGAVAIHEMNMADDTPYSQFIIIRVMDTHLLYVDR